MRPILSRTVAVAVAVTLALPVGSLPAEARDKKPRGGAFQGSVTGADGKPATGLTVVLTPLEAQGSEVVTGSTDSHGRFSVHPVPYGLYQVAFTRGNEGIPANRIVLVEPGSEVNVKFTLGPIEPQDAAAGITPGAQVAGLTQPATGVARAEERLTPRGIAWLRTGRGVATVVGLSALLVGGIILLTDSGNERTPPPPDTSGARR